MSNDYSYEEHAKTMPTIRAKFYICGNRYETDVDLDTITQALGIIPTRARKKSDFPLGSQKAKMARDVWNLNTPHSNNCYSISVPLEELANKLEAKKSLIKCLINMLDMNVHFEIPIHTNKQKGNPKMLFSRRVIAFMASIGADVGIDYYRY